jgi:hypothetical protein
MNIKIKSKKYGEKQISFDTSDYDIIKNYKWYVVKDDKTFYAQAHINRNATIKMHQLIIKCPSGKQIDHKNRNGLDNKKRNLRICTASQNCINRQKTSKNKSGYKGVYFNKSNNKWHVQIVINKIRYHIGYFKTPESAYKAYCKAAKKHHKDFCCLI